MFKGFSKLKISLKLMISVLVVEALSLASGVTVGRNMATHSEWVILGIVVTIVLSQYIAYLVAKNIDKTVSTIIEDLSSAAGNLSSISRDLTLNGHKLAEGTTQQAASMQETSSTLEESASMLHQTTQNTREADSLARQAKEVAHQGDSDMKIMLESMEELKKSSSEISKIIKVIDEIAFQTNILSLNAAVEAARAGDAGKGFAVVAEEVRNLAQRSAQAAKDTAVIIEGNINLSVKCLKITEQVSGSLVAIKDETNKVSELLEEISTASQEQEIGIVQINKAISHMEVVIHTNASAAQDGACSADQVAIFSEQMKEIVGSLVGLLKGADAIHSNMQMIKKSTAPSVSMSYSKAPEIESRHESERRSTRSHQKSALVGANVVNPDDVIPLGDF
jgi:hypothetical protein